VKVGVAWRVGVDLSALITSGSSGGVIGGVFVEVENLVGKGVRPRAGVIVAIGACNTAVTVATLADMFSTLGS